VESGSKTLKDALNEAMRDWVANVGNTFYIIGTVAGPHPYPMMVRDFQSVIGRECLQQMPELAGGSPTRSSPASARLECHGDLLFLHSARFGEADRVRPGAWVFRAAGMPHRWLRQARRAARNRTYLLQDEHGQIVETHSISAGLDYPGVGPEHAWLKDSGRADYVTIEMAKRSPRSTRCAATRASFRRSSRAIALAYAAKMAPSMPTDSILLVNLSGRGDKDMHTVAEKSGIRF